MKYSFIIATVVLCAVSCDYLDKREETSALTEEQVFGNEAN